MNILITGASGFIGSYLTNHFCELGHQVTAFCRTPEKIENLNFDNLKKIKGFIEDKDHVKKIVQGTDAVIHCALGWGDNAVDMLVRDTLPSVVLFEEAISAGVKKIIYTSSSVATGEYRLSMDEQSLCLPIDAYSATKAATENYLMALSRETKTQCNIVRPTYTFGNPIVQGASCQPDTKIKNMVQKAAANEPIELIENDGVQMIWVGRLIKVYAHLLAQDVTRSVVIAGSEKQIKWSNIAKNIIEKLGSSSPLTLEKLGWSEEGCLWSTQKLSSMIGTDPDLPRHLNAHIQYLCRQLDKQINHFESGVEA